MLGETPHLVVTLHLPKYCYAWFYSWLARFMFAYVFNRYKMTDHTSYELLDTLRHVLGASHVLTDGDLSSYEQDWRKRSRGKALAVVRPANTEEVVAVVKACANARVSIVPQGGNTGLVVGSIPNESGTQVVLSMQRMQRVRNVDADNLTGQVIELLISLNLGVQINVVIGQQHPQKEKIQQLCVQHSYNCHIQTNQMARLMAEADLAIGAGGSSHWERCCVGLPAIAVATAANQIPITNELSKLGGCLSLGHIQKSTLEKIKESLFFFLESSAECEKYSKTAFNLVDGNGGLRVFQELLNSMNIEILISDPNHPIMSYLKIWKSINFDSYSSNLSLLIINTISNFMLSLPYLRIAFSSTIQLFESLQCSLKRF